MTQEYPIGFLLYLTGDSVEDIEQLYNTWRILTDMYENNSEDAPNWFLQQKKLEA